MVNIITSEIVLLFRSKTLFNKTIIQIKRDTLAQGCTIQILRRDSQGPHLLCFTQGISIIQTSYIVKIWRNWGPHLTRGPYVVYICSRGQPISHGGEMCFPKCHVTFFAMSFGQMFPFLFGFGFLNCIFQCKVNQIYSIYIVLAHSK